MRLFQTSNTKLILLSSLIFWIPLILFASIANEVTERTPLPGDVATLHFIHTNFSPHFSGLFRLFTDLGGTIGTIAIPALLLGYILYRKRRPEAGILLAGVAGAALANVVIKLIFRRQRPELWQAVVSEPGFSFPSGHAMASSALVFSLIVISWQTRWRWIVIALGLPFMLMVALSRLYFGVHYPSDILGGWLASLIWVGVVVVILNEKTRTNLVSRTRSLFHGRLPKNEV